MLTELPPSRDALAGYAEAFAQAVQRAPDQLGSQQLRCGRGWIELCSVGRDLHRLIARPLVAAASREEAQGARLRIDVWDGQAWAGDPALTRACDEPGVRYGAGGEQVAYSQCRRYLRYTGPGFAFWLDRLEARVVGRCDSAGALSWWNRSRPLQPLIGTWLLDGGAVTVHAAMVATGRRAVLLPGLTGCGKSTCALAALEAGLDVLGDDFASVAMTESSAEGTCVYTTVKLTGEAVDRRPALARLVEPYGEGEGLLYAAELEPNPIVTSSDVAAIAFPQLSSGRLSRVTRLPTGRALLALLPCLQPVESGHVGGSFALARALVKRLPAFRLEVGHSATDLAAVLRELCGRAQ